MWQFGPCGPLSDLTGTSVRHHLTNNASSPEGVIAGVGPQLVSPDTIEPAPGPLDQNLTGTARIIAGPTVDEFLPASRQIAATYNYWRLGACSDQIRSKPFDLLAACPIDFFSSGILTCAVAQRQGFGRDDATHDPAAHNGLKK